MSTTIYPEGWHQSDSEMILASPSQSRNEAVILCVPDRLRIVLPWRGLSGGLALDRTFRVNWPDEMHQATTTGYRDAGDPYVTASKVRFRPQDIVSHFTA
jgi:hypothetical protein